MARNPPSTLKWESDENESDDEYSFVEKNDAEMLDVGVYIILTFI